MKKDKKKVDVFGIILIILFVIVLYCYMQLKVFNKPHIDFMGYTVFHVITGSMEPEIHINDVILVKLGNDVNVGDIVTYDSEGDFITHRVKEYLSDDKIICRGDSNNSDDSPIKKDDIVGIVKVIIPVTMLFAIATDPMVVITMIVTIAVVWYLFVYRKDETKKFL